MASGVLFDFGGTLDADGRPWVDQFFGPYGRLGGKVGDAAFGTAFRAADRRLEDGVVEPGDDYSTTVAKQIEILAELLPDGRRIDRPAWTAAVIGETRRIAARNEPALTDLGRRFTLAVVSNFFGNLRAVLEELGLLGHFESVTDSGAVGYRKPDPRAFLVTCGALRLPPSQCLMVGDNPTADIAPAAELGMQTCWVAPSGRPIPGGVVPTYRVDRLDRLAEVLG